MSANHEAAAFKIDLFVLGSSHLDIGQIQRRIRFKVRSDPPAFLWVTSPEDQVLRKLDWFRTGGGISDKQWRDVVAILRTNEGFLDLDYLSRVAKTVDLEELLNQAQSDAK